MKRPAPSVLALLMSVPILAATAASVPKAQCRKTDRPEGGLQGQTTKAERDSGASRTSFTCNTELVAQIKGEGAGYQMASFGDCAYYMTANTAAQQHRGTVVVDVSDSRNPLVTEYLDNTTTMLYPHESLKVNEKRKLLGGIQGTGTGFAVYDLSADCRHPILKGNIQLPGTSGHAGNFSPDGLTYYATQTYRGVGGILAVIDVTDTSNPQPIVNWKFPGDGRPHDLYFNEDGTRGYAPQPGQPDNPATSGPNGLVILDLSDIQLRRPNPQIRVISSVFWTDGAQAQMAKPITIKGKPHLIFSDELGAAGTLHDRAWACANGLPPFGYARIIDISDENNPKVVSKLSLEVSDPANCPLTADTPPDTFGYTSHYCTADDAKNATMIACSHFQAGLRVFDIRDPIHPREIAYYKPPARPDETLPGSTFATTGARAPRTADWTSSDIRFRLDRSEIWFTSHDNGFQIVKLHTDRGGGCSSAGGSFGALVALGLLPMLRRRRSRRRSRDAQLSKLLSTQALRATPPRAIPPRTW